MVAWGNAYPEVWRSGKGIQNSSKILGLAWENRMEPHVLESLEFMYFKHMILWNAYCYSNTCCPFNQHGQRRVGYMDQIDQESTATTIILPIDLMG